MPYDPIDASVGTKLRNRRTLVGMSQQALGRRLGITFQQIQKYERGLNRIGAGRLFRISEILDTDVTYFFDEVDPGSKPTEYSDTRGATLKQLQSRETLELVRYYTSINEKTVRSQILRMAKTLAEECTEE